MYVSVMCCLVRPLKLHLPFHWDHPIITWAGLHLPCDLGCQVHVESSTHNLRGQQGHDPKNKCSSDKGVAHHGASDLGPVCFATQAPVL